MFCYYQIELPEINENLSDVTWEIPTLRYLTSSIIRNIFKHYRNTKKYDEIKK